jgi:hypothetical protein
MNFAFWVLTEARSALAGTERHLRCINRQKIVRKLIDSSTQDGARTPASFIVLVPFVSRSVGFQVFFPEPLAARPARSGPRSHRPLMPRGAGRGPS